jgi:hypothetical protein
MVISHIVFIAYQLYHFHIRNGESNLAIPIQVNETIANGILLAKPYSTRYGIAKMFDLVIRDTISIPELKIATEFVIFL